MDQAMPSSLFANIQWRVVEKLPQNRTKPTLIQRLSPCNCCAHPISQRHHIFSYAEVGEGGLTVQLCANCHEAYHICEKVYMDKRTKGQKYETVLVGVSPSVHASLWIRYAREKPKEAEWLFDLYKTSIRLKKEAPETYHRAVTESQYKKTQIDIERLCEDPSYKPRAFRLLMKKFELSGGEKSWPKENTYTVIWSLIREAESKGLLFKSNETSTHITYQTKERQSTERQARFFDMAIHQVISALSQSPP